MRRMDLLPLRSTVDRPPAEPRLVSVDDDAADEVFAALSSRTARTILATLYDEPATASDLADAADTSLQNARYHLDKLVDAGLVEVVDTWYSERGTEMKVYAPANESVVVFAGGGDTRRRLREALGRLVGGLALLALASVVVEFLLRADLALPSGPTAEDAADVAEEAPATPTPGPEAADAVTTLPPGLLFFAGGLLVLLIATWWYWRRSGRAR